jgi:hypothetical protein
MIELIDTVSEALELARRRGVLPTRLGSAGIREEFSREVRDGAVFSARTTRAVYLQELRDRIDRMLAGGYESDRAQLRLELRRLLAQMRYDPETGFPGDERLGIPPAEPGSLSDLSSRRRIDLILETQERLMRGRAQRERGHDAGRLRRWPAWELVRVQSRRVPRGEGDTKSWDRRWFESGYEPVMWQGRARLMALKTSGVWARLGDSGIFDDALDVDVPPFAFRSGMGWREVDRAEAVAAGLDVAETDAEADVVEARTVSGQDVARPEEAAREMAGPRMMPAGLDEDFLRALQADRAMSRDELLRVERGGA